VAIALLFAGSADWGAINRKWRLRVAGLAAVLFAARLAVVGAVWVRADADYSALAPAIELVPEGGALAVAAPAEAIQAGGVPLLHFPVLAAARRDAFVATIFADPAQQPLRLTSEGARLAAEAPSDSLWRGVKDGSLPPLPGYDELAIVDPPRPIDSARLPGTIIFDSPRLILIRLPRAGETTDR
jgi:hypothetical protein